MLESLVPIQYLDLLTADHQRVPIIKLDTHLSSFSSFFVRPRGASAALRLSPLFYRKTVAGVHEKFAKFCGSTDGEKPTLN